MTKRFLVILAIFLICPLLKVASADPIELRMAMQNPDRSWMSRYACEPWVQNLEKATNGQIKIKVYYSQTLAKGIDTWNAVKNGIADIGWCFHGYWPGMFPLSDVIALPGIGFTTGQKGAEVAWKLYEKFPQIQKEYDDSHVILFFTNHPYNMALTKPVKKIEDLKGLKIRMPGGPHSDQIKALGGTPVSIGMPDTYMSLQKGVVDGIGGVWESILSFRHFEIAKYVTVAPLASGYFSLQMNKAKWNSLPKDIQKAFNDAGGLEGSKFWGYNAFDNAEEALLKKLKETNNPMEIYVLPQKENERWVEVSAKPLWERWTKNMEKKGYKEAPDILKAAMEFSKE